MPGIDEVPALACPLWVSELCGLRVPWQLLESEGAEQVDVTCTVAILMPYWYSAVQYYGALHGVHEMGMSVSPYDANHGSCADARRWFWFGGLWLGSTKFAIYSGLAGKLFTCNELFCLFLFLFLFSITASFL